MAVEQSKQAPKKDKIHLRNEEESLEKLVHFLVDLAIKDLKKEKQ